MDVGLAWNLRHPFQDYTDKSRMAWVFNREFGTGIRQVFPSVAPHLENGVGQLAFCSNPLAKLVFNVLVTAEQLPG